MNNKTPKNALIYVNIRTHFKEMIRVARVMKKSAKYTPLVFFVTPYEGWQQDAKLCEEEAIRTITSFNTKPKEALPSKWGWLYNTLRRIPGFPKKVRRLAGRILLSIMRRTRLLFKRLKSRGIQVSCLIFNKLKHYTHPFVHRLIPLLSPSIWGRLLLRVYQFLWDKFPYGLPNLSQTARHFFATVKAVLQEENIQLIVLPEHNLFYFTQLTTMIGRQNNIPSVIVPFTIANTIEWSEAFYNEPSRSLQSHYNKVCDHVFPHWVNYYKDRKLFLPIDLVLLHEMFQITPKNPWLLNSGDVDFLASESEAMSAYYVKAGIEASKLRTIGALYNDELYAKASNADKYRSLLYKTLKIDNNKPMIVCALPPNQCTGRSHLLEFASYEDILRCIISELSQYQATYNLIIHLHPRITRDAVTFLREYPVKIFSGDIAEIIPLSSLYVSSCSATIRMAVCCGIPVVNYDVYRYRYDDYTTIAGVLTVFDRLEYAAILAKLLSNTSFFNQIKTAQEQQSNTWGTLDGKAGENLLEALDCLY